MNRSPKFYVVAMLTSMVVGMVIAACFGPPQQVASEPEAAPAAQEMASTLSVVQERGNLVCVGNNQLPGFGFLDESGTFTGFDVDFCSAIAAAIFGDASAFEVRAATASERFTVLQSGEADVLLRNTTWTMSRDTDLGGNFGPTTFYDGQGIIVRSEDNISSIEDLDGAAICVQTGTTTELNLADQMAAAGISYEPVVFETADEAVAAYDEARCDAYTTDKSGLVSRQTTMADPAANTILNLTLSKEPLGPMVRHGDDQWFDIVKWVVYATMTAEEFGITSANVDDFMGSEDPNVRKLLGLEGEFGEKIGLSNDWAYNAIKQVGNYGEIYDRNLGPGTIFNLPRGLNSLYDDGGLLYAPPIR